MVRIDHYGLKEVEIQTDRYQNGRLAVELLQNGEDYASVSVNLPMEKIGHDEFVFKTYSENEGLYEALLRPGVIEWTGRTAGDKTLGPLPVCRLRSQLRCGLGA
jgi:hypothetical protein